MKKGKKVMVGQKRAFGKKKEVKAGGKRQKKQ